MFSAPNLPRTIRQSADRADPKFNMEGNWTGLASRDLFLAIRDVDPKRFKKLTLQLRFKGRMNILDSYGFGLMHNLAVSTPPKKVYEDDAMEIVEAFCQAEGDVNLLTSLGESALHFAAINYINEPVIMALVKNGADVLLKNKRNETPIDMAADMIDTEKISLSSFEDAMFCMKEAAEKQQGGQSISSKANLLCSEENWTGLARSEDLFQAIKDADPKRFKELKLRATFQRKDKYP